MSAVMASSVPQVGTQIGAYQVIREIGRGGMATIMAVRHIETGEERAIKLMLPGVHNDEVISRFNLEYDTLVRLNHPGVLRVFETGDFEGIPYIVMELIAGIEVGAAVLQWRDLAPAERFARARRVLIQVASTLEYVHEQGLVHRDVTPSNIMLLNDGHIRLMDFGVVKELGADLTTVGEVVGTAAYIAPEQITGARVDARTDLYSLGAVLYLMLTGKRPFSARTLAGYLDKHLHRPVRPPRALVPTVPEDLNSATVRLLAKIPGDRFGSASHLLHALNAKAASDDAMEATSWDPGVVGRASEIAQVREAVARLAAGEGGLMVIDAAYGMGRSALIDEAEKAAERFGLRSFSGRSRAPDQRAFETYRAPFDGLVDDGSGPTALAVAFGKRLADDETLERWRVFSAFSALMAEGGPKLLVLDDLDQSDSGSIEMTEYLVRNLVGEAKHPILVLVTCESGVGVDRLRRLMDESETGVCPERLQLGPLGLSAVEELLLSLVREDPRVQALCARIHKESEGVPFFVREMLRGLMDMGVIARAAKGARGRICLSLAEIDGLTLPIPRSIREAISDRLSGLKPQEKTLLGVLALARQEVDHDLLAIASQMDGDQVLAGTDTLIEAGLVIERFVGEAAHLELAQNRLKDVVVEGLSPAVIQEIHRRVGEALESRYRCRVSVVVEALADHFEQGDVAAKAYPYLILAADKLMQRTFVAQALEYMDRAMAIESQARRFMTLHDADARLAELCLKRARALYHLGQLNASAEELARASGLADALGDPKLQIGVLTEQGCQARRMRDLDGAERSLSGAITLAREHGHGRMEILPLYERGGVAWARGDLDRARDWWVEGLARSEQFNDETRLAWGYGGLGLLAMCRGQSAEARRKLEQAIEVCQRHGLMERLTVARINLIELYHFTGNFRKGLAISDETVNQAREVRYRYGVGLGMRYRTIMLIDIGRFAEAMDNALASLKIHQDMQTREDELASLVVACRAGLAQGALEEVEPMLDAATALLDDYDTEGFAPVLHAWRARVYAGQGRMSEACDAVERAAAVPTRPWPAQRARSNLNLARAYMMLDAREEALSLAEEALRLSDASGYRHYAMRSRALIIAVSEDEAVIARHRRVAEALARSLAANLSREDASEFLKIHGVKPMVTLI
jgi:tetratricopeptide (TPR) repeat protein